MDYYNTGSNQDNDDSDTSSAFARVNRVMLSKSSEEYRQRRERNNAAVKKSRFKSKQKTLETQKRVDQLKDENCQLERRVESLTRELNFMRAIFVPRRNIHHQSLDLQQSNQQVPSLAQPPQLIQQPRSSDIGASLPPLASRIDDTNIDRNIYLGRR